MFKNTYGQDYLVRVGIIALMVANILVAFGIPLAAILTGFLAGVIIPRVAWKKKWADIDIPEWRKYVASILVALGGSQMGWLALLV